MQSKLRGFVWARGLDKNFRRTQKKLLTAEVSEGRAEDADLPAQSAALRVPPRTARPASGGFYVLVLVGLTGILVDPTKSF